MFYILIIAGLLVFAYACKTFDSRYINKAGWIAMLAATYLGGLGLTGSHAWGAFALSLWFMLPWVEILGRVRKLRFPIKSEVKHRFPPPRDIFPDLEEITEEVEHEGFEKADDAGWKWEESDHFVRILYNAEKKLQASISVAQQGEYVFSYASLTTRTREGLNYTSTNYPFSLTMKLAPQQHMNRCAEVESFAEMLTSHQQFLALNSISEASVVEQDAEQLPTGLAADLTQQIDHNLDKGVIVRSDEKHFRYSWRGCFFLWWQVLKDMIRV